MTVTFFCPKDTQSVETYPCQCLDINGEAWANCRECKGSGYAESPVNDRDLNVCASNAISYLMECHGLMLMEPCHIWEGEALMKFRDRCWEIANPTNRWSEKAQRYSDRLYKLAVFAIAANSEIVLG